MKLEWHISKENWVEGINQLRKKTYAQKRYHSNALIEQRTPMSLFLFYGVVATQSFFISPVIMGLNRMVIVISGHMTETETDAVLLIEVAIAPFIRNFVSSVYLCFSICICLAIIFAKHTTEKYIIIAFLLFVAAFLAFWLLLVRRIIKKQSIFPLATLTGIFYPEGKE